MLPISDTSYIDKFVTHETRRVMDSNGAVTSLPIGKEGSRVFGITSWSRQALGDPKLGRRRPISCLTYNNDRNCATIVDSEDDWRVDYKMSARAWEALRTQMHKENEMLDRTTLKHEGYECEQLGSSSCKRNSIRKEPWVENTSLYCWARMIANIRLARRIYPRTSFLGLNRLAESDVVSLELSKIYISWSQSNMMSTILSLLDSPSNRGSKN